MMPLENKFKLARKHLGKTQVEMADAVGISKRGWQTYEEGKSVPGGNVFKALSDLGFNASWFFNDDVPMLLREKSECPVIVKEKSGYHSPPGDDIGLGECVELLAKIYNSGNKVLIRAIAANLNAFSDAVDNKAMAQKAIDMMDEMNKRMLVMENDLAKLKEENEVLRKGPPGHKQQAIG